MKQVSVDINTTTDSELNDLIAKLRSELDFCPIFFAVDKQSGLYTTNYQYSLKARQAWISAEYPTIDEVLNDIKQFDIAHNRSKFTNDKNSAESWTLYSIKEYRKYLPNCSFVEIEFE